MPDPLHVVFCESTINGVGFVQYLRASSEDAAKTMAAAPGVRPLSAKVFYESGDWMLDAINRTQLGIAAANDGLKSARSVVGNRPLFWTVFWAVIAAMVCWMLASWGLTFLFLLASHSR